MNNLEAFLNSHLLTYSPSDIDYVGVNFLISDKKVYIKNYKIYYNNTIETNINFRNNLYLFLSKSNLLRNISKVIDNNYLDCYRYDCILKGRKNDKMLALFEYLSIELGWISSSIREIKQLAAMKINDYPEFNYASLFHLGYIVNKYNTIIGLKFYFMTQKCKNVDVFGSFNSFENFYFLNYLKDYRGFKSVISIINDILDCKSSDILFAGADYYIDEECRYKIYLKARNRNFSADIYKILRNRFNDLDLNELDFLYRVCEKENLYLDGIALWSDINENININTYLKWRKSVINE